MNGRIGLTHYIVLPTGILVYKKLLSNDKQVFTSFELSSDVCSSSREPEILKHGTYS